VFFESGKAKERTAQRKSRHAVGHDFNGFLRYCGADNRAKFAQSRLGGLIHCSNVGFNRFCAGRVHATTSYTAINLNAACMSRLAYPSPYYFYEGAKGGHFAAWDQPELFSQELRQAFRSLRQLIGENHERCKPSSIADGFWPLPEWPLLPRN
jgi:hypothetical protein